MTNILRIDASARRNGSVSRDLVDRLISRFTDTGTTKVTTRDLADGVPVIDETWVGANFTPAEARSIEQRAALALSDTLVAELQAADTVIIGLPIYNFGVPAALKAWIDLVARAGLTFEYTQTGPRGLLTDKKVIIAVASGGVKVGSDYDFATNYIRHVLGFIGLTDVTFLNADATAVDLEGTLKAARNAIDALPLAA